MLSTQSYWSNAGSLTELMNQHQPLLSGRQGSVMSNGCEFNCHLLNGWQPLNYGTSGNLPEYGDLQYSFQSPSNYLVKAQSLGAFKLEDSPLPRLPTDPTSHNLEWTLL
jgi:hypothetical protein